MDRHVAVLLSTYLPPEIVEEIDDYLITAYRREAATKLFKIGKEIRRFDSVDVCKIQDKGRLIVYSFYNCAHCGELKSFTRLDWGQARSHTHMASCENFLSIIQTGGWANYERILISGNRLHLRPASKN